MTARPNPERRWATGVLVVSGLISLSFNTRHAFYATTLPAPLALGYGAGPVVLAAAQSHVVALQASRGDLVGGWRKGVTFGLVIGALALSFLGIYDLLRIAVPDPIPGTPFNEPAILTPVVVDLMAIAALHELLRPAAARLASIGDPNPVRIPELSFETHPQTGLQTQSDDRSETQTIVGSETRSAPGSTDPVADRSETQTGPAKRTRTSARKTGPAKTQQTEPKTKINSDEDLLERAHDVDSAHLQEHGRHISAENLRKALRIGKPAALELVQQIRGTRLDVAK